MIPVNEIEMKQILCIVTESGRQIGPHACAVCQNIVEGNTQSRALPPRQASQYGLREDQVAPGARVCNTCRCKAVRGRYTACPLLGCPNLNNTSSKTKVKRLRALPAKWFDLPAEVRDPIIQEFRKYTHSRPTMGFTNVTDNRKILFLVNCCRDSKQRDEMLFSLLQSNIPTIGASPNRRYRSARRHGRFFGSTMDGRGVGAAPKSTS